MADLAGDINKAYKHLQDLADDAYQDLKSAAANGYIDFDPTDYNTAHKDKAIGLMFDPGTPEAIKMPTEVDLPSIIASIDTYITNLEQVHIDNFPPTPTGIVYQNNMWLGDLAGTIRTSLDYFMSTEGIPGKDYQDAVFKEDYERNLQTLNDLYDLADAKTGARGFSYPNSLGTSLKLDAQIKYQYDKAQISRTISKNLVEWAKQNYQFAIEKGLTDEQINMDFTYKYSTAYAQIYKDVVTAILEKYKAELSQSLEPINALIKEMTAEIDYAKIQTDIDKQHEQLKQSRSQINIQEALERYKTDSTAGIAKMGQRLHALEQAMQQAAVMVQANTNSIIGVSTPSTPSTTTT